MVRIPGLTVVVLTCSLAALAAPAADPGDGAPPDTAPPAGTAPAPAPSAAPAAPKAPVARNIGGPGDYGLRERFVKRLMRDVDLAPSGIRVVLVNGGVVLSGKVPHWTARRRALVMAGSERGIVNVTDQMEIPRGEVKDAEIVKGMAALLEGVRDTLELKDLDISVTDGVATLSGTVRNFAARVRAEEVAGTVLGATRIVNRLRPANAPAGTDDVTIRRKIAGYLKDYREFPYSGEIRVQFAGGRARIEGRVPLYLARQQAGTMTALVGGVREVDNRIAVDPSLQTQDVTVTEVP